MNAGPLFFIVRADAAIATVSAPRRQARRVRRGEKRHGAACAADPEPPGDRGESAPARFRDRRRCGPARRRRRAAPMPHSQPGNDRAERARRYPRSALCAGRGWSVCWAPFPITAAPPCARARCAGSAAIPISRACSICWSRIPRVADETVAAVVRAIAGNADELARLNPLFDGLGGLLREVRAEDGVALHPGAAEAYRALGLMR